MKKELIERLRRFLTAHDMIGTPASDGQVLCAEQELGVKFSSDYIDFIKNFGTAYAGMGHRTKRFFQWSGKMGERL